jgi:hypothetical protein
MSGPMRTAIMSFATCPPDRTPASNRWATMSVPVVDRNFNIDVGVLRQQFAQGGQQDGMDRMLAP